jgi:hypothetical protein
MALPWLLGAAAVATVGYLANSSSSSSSSSSDDYDERQKEAKKKEAKRQEAKRQKAKDDLHEKWDVKHNVKSIDAPKIQKLIKQEEKLKKESEELEALALEMKSL